ncbi:NAD(P)/FAD-dependent oxidoreductase, partial [bacterium]|nr:NAD(P)/FAD-dependent oxidoreductase [bacterium]
MKWFITKAVEKFSYLLLTLFLFPQLLWAETLDVVIIGAGLTGTYTGWRLVENGRKNVHIFEGSDRIGGHLYTVFLPGMDHVPVELGVMEFFTSQKKVANLVNYLKLPTSPFTTQDQNNLIYVRGKRFHEMDEKKDLPYNLAPEEMGKDPSALILDAIGKIDPKFDIDAWATQKDQ